MSISLSTLANGTVATSTISAPDAESTGSNDGLGITSSSNSTMSADDDGGNIDGVNQLVLQMVSSLTFLLKGENRSLISFCYRPT